MEESGDFIPNVALATFLLMILNKLLSVID